MYRRLLYPSPFSSISRAASWPTFARSAPTTRRNCGSSKASPLSWAYRPPPVIDPSRWATWVRALTIVLIESSASLAVSAAATIASRSAWPSGASAETSETSLLSRPGRRSLAASRSGGRYTKRTASRACPSASACCESPPNHCVCTRPLGWSVAFSRIFAAPSPACGARQVTMRACSSLLRFDRWTSSSSSSAIRVP